MDGEFIRDPAAFNAKAHSIATRRVHTTEPGHFAVTAATHPALFEVFETISHDGGGSAGHDSYSVPAGMEECAARADAFLARLSPEQRQDAAIGEESEAEEAMAAHAQSVEEWSEVSNFLNLFFDDWGGFE